MSSEVIFEGEDTTNNTVSNIQIVRGAPTGMLAWLVKNKVVQNAKQAEQVLLGVAIISVLVAIGVFIVANPRTLPAQTPASSSWPKPLSSQ